MSTLAPTVAPKSVKRDIEQKIQASLADLETSAAAMDVIIAASGTPTRGEIRDVARGVQRCARAIRRLDRLVRQRFDGTD